MITEIFQYGFITRGIEAGIIVGMIAPLIGIFLVLKRYSLIADTLSHVSLAGIAIGIFAGINPAITALAVSVAAAFGIERLRFTKKIYGESALALFLSGSLALALVILSLARGLNANLMSYLFGSIVTVTQNDIWLMLALALVVFLTVAAFFKELVYSSFDEDSARVSGVPVRQINTILIVLASLAVSLAIPIVGVLLISALIVIPVIAALQFRQSFIRTIIYAEAISVFSVISGIFASYYFNLSTGGTIVLIMIAIFAIIFFSQKNR